MHVRNKHHGDTGVYVGRGSPLGNPYKIGEDGDREQVIDKYREWLEFKILRSDPVVTAALKTLKESDTLICYCYPLPCHGNVIIELWHWATEHKLL